jgi:hypothetical protein
MTNDHKYFFRPQRSVAQSAAQCNRFCGCGCGLGVWRARARDYVVDHSGRSSRLALEIQSSEKPPLVR